MVKRRFKLDEIQVSRMIELYKEGWFMRDLSRKFNISNTTVRNYLKRNDVILRDSNEEISRFAKTRTGDKNGFWNGGKTKRADGYILIRTSINNRVLEHRHVMEKCIGRPLRKDEHVHHVNGIKHDNRIENLKLMTASEHSKLTVVENIENGKIKHFLYVEKEDFKNLITSGLSSEQICNHYGFSLRTFYNKLESLGLKEWYKKWRKIS